MSLAVAFAVLLSHPDYRVRDAAEASLASIGPNAHAALCWASGGVDPERASRAARLCDRLVEGPFPYIDALPDDFPNKYAVIHRYMQRAVMDGFSGNKVGLDWPGYRHATVLWLADGGDRGLLGTMRRRTACYEALSRWEPE